jgi:hypothetical protein
MLATPTHVRCTQRISAFSQFSDINTAARTSKNGTGVLLYFCRLLNPGELYQINFIFAHP